MTARVSGVTSRTGHSGVMVARKVRELAALPRPAIVRGTLWERVASASRIAASEARFREGFEAVRASLAPVVARPQTDADGERVSVYAIDPTRARVYRYTELAPLELLDGETDKTLGKFDTLAALEAFAGEHLRRVTL